MSRRFEHAAMVALAPHILTAYVQSEGRNYNWFADRDLLVWEELGYVVVYPAASPRKNPACVVIEQRAGTFPNNRRASHVFSRGVLSGYVYEAGNYDMANNREKPALG